MRLLLLALAICALVSAAHAAESANLLLLPNMPAVLGAGNETALAIFYSPTSEGADAAFISYYAVVKDGEKLPNGAVLRVVYDANGLKQIKAGGEPDRSAWVDLPVKGYTAGLNITQTVYSSASGYEANFEPSIPLSVKGRRVWIEYANDYWLLGDMDAATPGVLLYKEAAFGHIGAGRNLSYGPYLLSFLLYDGASVLVRFQAGLEPTYFAVQQFNDAASKRLTVWVDYNSSQGPLGNADCYLEGDITGSLSLINNRYQGKLDYQYLPARTYTYAVSCSKEGFEPKTLVLNFTASPHVAPTAAPSSQPTQISGTTYTPPANQPTLLQLLDRLIHEPFWWLSGS